MSFLITACILQYLKLGVQDRVREWICPYIFKKQMKYMKQKFLRHWTSSHKAVVPERKEAIKGIPAIASVFPLDRVSSSEHRGRNAGGTRQTPRAEEPDRPRDTTAQRTCEEGGVTADTRRGCP